MTEISLILWLFLSATLGSLAACYIVIWHSARILPKRINHGMDLALKAILEDNPEVIDRVIAQTMNSAFGMIHQKYEDDPADLEAMFMPIIKMTVQKVKDHIFSSKGVLARKAHAEADDIEGSVIEELTGGMINAKLLDEHPILGSIMQMVMKNPQLIERFAKGSGGGSTGSGSSGSGGGGLIQQ